MVKKRVRLTEDNDPLTSTDKVLAGFEQLSQLTSQPDNHIKSQFDGKLASQQVDKSIVRKATFQLQESVLEQLDQLHLQLQLELGKVNAPYKEVIVEEAITRLLEKAEENREELVQLLQQRQSLRKWDAEEDIFKETDRRFIQAESLRKAIALDYLSRPPEVRSRTLILAGTKADSQAIAKSVRQGLIASGT